MMKLYFDTQSRSQVAKWMLDEAGVNYEIVPTLIKEKAHKKPEYLKIIDACIDRLQARPKGMKFG